MLLSFINKNICPPCSHWSHLLKAKLFWQFLTNSKINVRYNLSHILNRYVSFMCSSIITSVKILRRPLASIGHFLVFTGIWTNALSFPLNQTILTAKNIVIATGGRPKYPTNVSGAARIAYKSFGFFFPSCLTVLISCRSQEQWSTASPVTISSGWESHRGKREDYYTSHFRFIKGFFGPWEALILFSALTNNMHFVIVRLAVLLSEPWSPRALTLHAPWHDLPRCHAL